MQTNMGEKSVCLFLFLVITHNRRTMQHADAIYSVTHVEPGISTKVSVKFDKAELAVVAADSASG
jgi:chromosome segregation protein